MITQHTYAKSFYFLLTGFCLVSWINLTSCGGEDNWPSGEEQGQVGKAEIWPFSPDTPIELHAQLPPGAGETYDDAKDSYMLDQRMEDLQFAIQGQTAIFTTGQFPRWTLLYSGWVAAALRVGATGWGCPYPADDAVIGTMEIVGDEVILKLDEGDSETKSKLEQLLTHFLDPEADPSDSDWTDLYDSPYFCGDYIPVGTQG